MPPASTQQIQSISLSKSERLITLPLLLDIASKDQLEHAFAKLAEEMDEKVLSVWIDARACTKISAGGIGVFLRLIDEYPAPYKLFGAQEALIQALERVDCAIPQGKPQSSSIKAWFQKASHAILRS